MTNEQGVRGNEIIEKLDGLNERLECMHDLISTLFRSSLEIIDFYVSAKLSGEHKSAYFSSALNSATRDFLLEQRKQLENEIATLQKEFDEL